ncbi:sensor histidine kinase [Roseateles paludis]|uniref:Histidine kinase n=1 Tax=Roseateles paludis TaxID=3145238 RepID=A0ABV0FVL6_9BURK
MPDTPAPARNRSPLCDWRQWFYPGPARQFTPDEMARAGQQPWPEGIDAYLLINALVIVGAVWRPSKPAFTFSLVMAGTLMATVAILAVARLLWRQPTRKLLNIASYGAMTLVMLVVVVLMLDRQRAAVQALLPLAIAAVAVSISGWWILTLYRVAQIEARLRELDEQAERERLASQLAAAQIQPHFLFNTLASLQHWVDTGDVRAAPLLRSFTAYLRATLPMFEHALLPLASEVEMVRSYLAIMQARLGERLQFSIDIDPVIHAQLPPGTLLTLTENAVHHGIEPQLAGGRIELAGRREGDTVVLTVRDDGAGLNPEAQDGVGLANIRRRLQQVFGSRATLTLQQAAPGCLVTLKIAL